MVHVKDKGKGIAASSSHSASTKARDTPGPRKDRPTGLDKNPAPKTTERRPSQTPVQEGEPADRGESDEQLTRPMGAGKRMGRDGMARESPGESRRVA